MSFQKLMRGKETLYIEENDNENVIFTPEATPSPEEKIQHLYRDATDDIDIGTTEAEQVEIQTESDIISYQIDKLLYTAENSDSLADIANETLYQDEVTEEDAQAVVESFISFHRGSGYKRHILMESLPFKRIMNTVSVENDIKRFKNPKHTIAVAVEGFKESAWRAYDAVVNVLRKFMNFTRKVWDKMKYKFKGRGKALDQLEKRVKSQAFDVFYKFNDYDELVEFLERLYIFYIKQFISACAVEGQNVNMKDILKDNVFTESDIHNYIAMEGFKDIKDNVKGGLKKAVMGILTVFAFSVSGLASEIKPLDQTPAIKYENAITGQILKITDKPLKTSTVGEIKVKDDKLTKHDKDNKTLSSYTNILTGKSDTDKITKPSVTATGYTLNDTKITKKDEGEIYAIPLEKTDLFKSPSSKIPTKKIKANLSGSNGVQGVLSKGKHVKLMEELNKALEKAVTGSFNKHTILDFLKKDSEEVRKGGSSRLASIYDEDELKDVEETTYIYPLGMGIGSNQLSLQFLKVTVDDEDNDGMFKASIVTIEIDTLEDDAKDYFKNSLSSINSSMFPMLITTDPKAMYNSAGVALMKELLLENIKYSKKLNEMMDGNVNKTYDYLNKIMNNLDKLKSKNRLENDNDKDIKSILQTMGKLVPVISRSSINFIPGVIDTNMQAVKKLLPYFTDRKTIETKLS